MFDITSSVGRGGLRMRILIQLSIKYAELDGSYKQVLALLELVWHLEVEISPEGGG